MLVYRLLYTFAIGLTLGCALLLVPRQPIQVAPYIEIALPPSIEQTRPSPVDGEPFPTLALHDLRVAAAWPAAAPTIIDVAPGITAAQLALAIRLAPDEYIVGIDGVPVQGDLDAGVQLASLDRRSRQFLDLQVRGPVGERRIVVLMH